jgi:hypothetical protein
MPGTGEPVLEHAPVLLLKFGPKGKRQKGERRLELFTAGKPYLPGRQRARLELFTGGG